MNQRHESSCALAGGSYVGGLTAYWGPGVNAYTGGNAATTVITGLTIACWDADGWSYAFDRFFDINLPSDPHWFSIQSTSGYAIDDDDSHASGITSLRISCVALIHPMTPFAVHLGLAERMRLDSSSCYTSLLALACSPADIR